jgi:hypothetical protein
MQQFSTHIDRLAAAHHLGTPLTTYRATVGFSNLLYTLIAVVLIGGLVMQGLRSQQWLVVLPLLLIVVLLWELLQSTRWVRTLRMVVCSEGLLRLWSDEAESMRWDEIRELWRDRQGNYAFSRADGTRFIINHVYRHADLLGATVEEEVTRRLLPQVLASYQHGEPVRFGQVQVSRYGISTGADLLSWNSVGDVQVHGGLLVITQQGTALGGLSVSIESTPNLCVLEALITSLVEGELVSGTPRLKGRGLAGASPVLASQPDQTQPEHTDGIQSIWLSGYVRSEIRYVGMRGQSQPLRCSIKQVYMGQASVLHAKPFHNRVEATITSARRGL